MSIQNKIAGVVLAGLTGEKELHAAIQPLCEEYDIDSTAPTPVEIARDFQQIAVDMGNSQIAPEVVDNRLKTALRRAVTAKNPHTPADIAQE